LTVDAIGDIARNTYICVNLNIISLSTDLTNIVAIA